MVFMNYSYIEHYGACFWDDFDAVNELILAYQMVFMNN